MSRATAFLARVLARPRHRAAAIAAITFALLGVAIARVGSNETSGIDTDAVGAARDSSVASATSSTSSTITTTVAPTASVDPSTSTSIAVTTTDEPAKVVTAPERPSTSRPRVDAPPSSDPPAVEPAAEPGPTPTEPPAQPAPPAPEPAPPAPNGMRCLVRLHGKGGSGNGTFVDDGVTVLSPTGNASGWSGRQWLYYPDSRYQEARAVVARAVDDAGCGQVIIDGFSNGAAFAVKLFCRGESFDGRLVRVVADDPVPDAGANDCAAAPGVALTIYWTGALESTAQPGWNCAEQDWTCDGGVTVGISAYAANAGTAVKKSPHDDHQWYMDAPELQLWR